MPFSFGRRELYLSRNVPITSKLARSSVLGSCAPRVTLVSPGRHEGAGITEGATTMARRADTNAETRDDWRRLIPPLVANAADFPHLEAPRLRLEAIDAEV